MILSENFNLTKYGLQVRLVQVEDAAFILSLRADPIRTKYMLTLDADVAKQQQWILAYKKESELAKIITSFIMMKTINLWESVEFRK